MKQIEIPIKPLNISKAWQGRRFKTALYHKWQKDVLALLGRHSPIYGKIALYVEFFIKNDKMSDIDNFLKTLQDTLVEIGIIEDDRFIYELHCFKFHSKDEKIRITIQQL